MADVTLTPFGFVLIEVGASDGTWGGKTNDNWTLLDGLLDGTGAAITPNLTAGSWEISGVAVTPTAAQINRLATVTSTAADLNLLSGASASGLSAAELLYVNGVTSAIQTQINAKAATVSPTFTGVPIVPTAALGTNTSQIASTAFVIAEIPSKIGVANYAPVKTAINAGGSAPIYAARAWASFNGTAGTLTDSGNIASITKNGTGDYTITFTTAMADANYAVSFNPGNTAGGSYSSCVFSRSTTAVRVFSLSSTSGFTADGNLHNLVIFG